MGGAKARSFFSEFVSKSGATWLLSSSVLLAAVWAGSQGSSTPVAPSCGPVLIGQFRLRAATASPQSRGPLGACLRDRLLEVWLLWGIKWLRVKTLGKCLHRASAQSLAGGCWNTSNHFWACQLHLRHFSKGHYISSWFMSPSVGRWVVYFPHLTEEGLRHLSTYAPPPPRRGLLLGSCAQRPVSTGLLYSSLPASE